MQNVHQVRTPRDVLAHRLRYLGLAEHASLAFARFPQLADAAAGLAWHFTERAMFPVSASLNSKTALFDICLANAFEWANYAAAQEDCDARRYQTAFMAGLMYHVTEIIHVAARLPGGVEWDPFRDVGLAEWLPLNPGAIVEVRADEEDLPNHSDAEIRYLILRRMFPAGGSGAIDADLKLVFSPTRDFFPPRG